MKLELSDEALAFGAVARDAIEAAGGDRLVQDAERDPSAREAAVAPVLAELGAWDLDPASSDDELEAAAALCRSAGWWALPYPVAERLCRPGLDGLAGTVVVDGPAPSAAVAGLEHRWLALGLDRRRAVANALPLEGSVRHSALVTGLALAPLDGTADDAALALALVLPCWTLLGMLDRAMVLTRAYVREREQFGQTLSRFQSVQFQLTDAEVERCGLEELARYSLWSIEVGEATAVADALALRLAAIDAAEVVFRITHQLHGAIGFCDEAQLSWLSRYSQPLRRLPTGLAATRRALTEAVGRDGVTGLFSGGDR